MELAKLFEAVKKKHPKKVEGKKLEDFTEEQLVEALAEDAAPEGVLTNATLQEALTGAGLVTADQLALREARAEARARIAECNLPKAAKEKLLKDFAARTEIFTEAQIDEAIKAERAYVGTFLESGRVSMGGLIAADVEDRSVKVADMLDAFFDPKHKDHRAVHSFKECYIEITGDRGVTGRLEHCDRSRLAESVGGDFRESLDAGSFANVLGNSITRRMVAEYNNDNTYDGWQQICSIVPVSDFRTQERTRFGGYGDLPAVAERGNYAALNSPTDEKATYGVTKRGGTEDVTLEMIKNDDVGVIQRIPQRLGRVAKRTLSKFVFDFIRLNPVIYDGLTLFHANHGNLGSDALASAGMANRRLAMLKNTELSSGERLGIGPAGILVPLDLQETAVNLFNRNTNLDKTFVQAMTLTIIPVWYWTDANDWASYADPRDIPGLEIGFLDGRQEPELFVQDMPNVGSMFNNDTLTYKIKHTYGGNILDYRGFDKCVL